MFSRKGLSDIVTNVLIILLVLVAVGIVWYFVQPFIRGSIGGVTVDPYTISLSVKANSVTDDGTNVGLIVERGAGKGDLVGFNVIITDSSGVNKVSRQNVVIGEFETASVNGIDYISLGLADVKYVSVVPIIETADGKEVNGQQSSPVAPSGSSSVCTDGATNGACTTSNGYPGTLTCQGGNWNCLTSLYCGDGILTTTAGRETCEINSGGGFYGANCDYQGTGNPGNNPCKIGTVGTDTCKYDAAVCSCWADWNNNGFVDGGDIDNDLAEWAIAFNAGNMAADCNHDGVLDSNDGDPTNSDVQWGQFSCVWEIWDSNYNQGIPKCNYN